MAGEISPDMMFCEFCPKYLKMSADGCRSVLMGAIRSIVAGERKNKTKRARNGLSGHVLR